jgi:ABC-type multidrug transport system ATPase subunit
VEASDYKAEPGVVAGCRAIAHGVSVVPSIEVSDLHKSYGSTVALAGVSFSVEPGEVVGFLGPNGAGKTTTMKMILVLDEPTSGLDPNQIAEIRALIRDIGKTRTILLSTHILQEVSALCSRVLIVSQGRIVGFGTPAEIEAQSAGGSRIEVLVRGDADLRSPLAALVGVLDVREAAGEGPGTRAWSLLCEADADPRAEIFEAAVAGGWALLGLHREPESLEEAFRALTLPS